MNVFVSLADECKLAEISNRVRFDVERLGRWDQLKAQLRVGGLKALVPMARGGLARTELGLRGPPYAFLVTKRRRFRQRPQDGNGVEARSHPPWRKRSGRSGATPVLAKR